MNKYEIRELASKSEIFYENVPNSKNNVSRFYKHNNNSIYISIPIVKSIIDRIVNYSFGGIVLKGLDIIDNNLNEEMRKAITLSLVYGNDVVLFKSKDGKFSVEHWNTLYIDIIDDETIMIEYLLDKKTNTMSPVYLPEDVKSRNYVSIIFDKNVYDKQDINLGFAPFNIFRNIDRNSNLSLPFPYRFLDLVIEYNQIISQMSRNIKVLQNVWTTNKNMENPDNPIRIDAEVINYLGMDGKLEQAVKNLDLTEERQYLSLLKLAISEAAQVPSQLIALENISSLPSGVALKILFQPLLELVQRLQNNYKSSIKQFVEKYIFIKYGVVKNIDIEFGNINDILMENTNDKQTKNNK